MRRKRKGGKKGRKDTHKEKKETKKCALLYSTGTCGGKKRDESARLSVYPPYVTVRVGGTVPGGWLIYLPNSRSVGE